MPTIQTDWIIAIIAVLAPIVTGILTWMSARKNVSADVLKSDRVIAVEALEKAGDLAVQVASKSTEQLDECRDDLMKLQDETAALKISIVDFKIRLRQRAGKIRNIVSRHEYFQKELTAVCPGYEVIQGLLLDVVNEIEAEAKLL